MHYLFRNFWLKKNQKQNLLQLSEDFESPACGLQPAACSLRPSAYESVLFIRTAGTQFSDLYTAVDTVG